MDAKQLYRKFDSKFQLAIWLDENNEYVDDQGKVKYEYCGIGDEFKTEFVSRKVEEYFSNDEIYLIISSGNSYLAKKSEVAEQIGKHIHRKEIGLMDKSFTKLMFFSTIGVFKRSVVVDFPKSRVREEGKPMEVLFLANIYESKTEKVVRSIEEPFEKLSKELSKDYQGCMEYLWIELELIEGREPFPFRFQKRVSQPASFKENYTYNVGNYSITPDFKKLEELPEDQICDYILNLVYDSTQVLIDKKKRLGNFQAEQFRSDFVEVCKELGYTIKEK